MAGNEDIMIDVKIPVADALKSLDELKKSITAMEKDINTKMKPAVDDTGSRLQGLGNKVSGAGEKIQNAMGTETALAFAAAGGAALSFTKQCVSSAIASESAWTRFGGMVNSSGGNWKKQEEDVRSWAKTHAQSVGRAVGDVRDAMTTYMQIGLTLEQTQGAMNATAGVAARAGITEAEASTAVSQALMGKGKALQKLTGIRVDDYKGADGQVDRERLLNDLYSQNQGAISDYANSTEAQVNKIQNSWATFKTSIGQALLPVVKIIANVVSGIVGWFNKLDGPWKTLIAIVLSVGGAIGVAVGALGLLAPVLINVGKMISAMGKLKKAMTWSNVIGKWDEFKSKVNSVKDTINGFKTTAKNIGGTIKSGVLNSWNTLKTRITSAKSTLQSYNITSKISAAGGKIQSAVLSSWNALKLRINSAKTAITGFDIRQKLSTISMKAHTIATTVWNGITKLATIAQTALNAVLSMNPIYLVVIAVMALIAVLGYLYFNNEQVRNTINALGNYVKGTLIAAWNALVGALQPVINALKTLWGWISPIINDIGALFGALMGGGDIGSVFQKLSDDVGNLFNNLWNSLTQTDLGSKLMMVVAPIPTLLYQAFTAIAPMVAPAVTNFVNSIVSYFSQLGSGIIQVISTIPARLGMFFMMVVNTIRARLMQAVNVGRMLATLLRQAIVTRITSLIARTRQVFQNIVNAIRTRLMSAVNAAKQRAREIVSGVVNKVKELPGKVGQEISSLADTIKNKLVEAGKRAFEGAKQLVAQFLAGMGIHSPGIIQRSTASEFSSLPSIISSAGVSAANSTRNAARGIVTSWNSNMQTLSAPIEQFDAFNPLLAGQVGLGVTTSMTGANMNILGQNLTGNNTTRNTNSNVSNNTVNTDNTSTTYNIRQLTFDCNNLEGNGKEMFYGILEELSRGGV